MVKLAKYLKPFIFALLLAALLLFGQAMCDLNLPNYMSKIVNIGIQQYGIENAVPEAISAQGMLFEKEFMTDTQKTEVDNCYSRLSSREQNSAQSAYLNKYPLLKEEDIYVLNNITKEQRESLSKAFGESAWTFINTMKNLPKMDGQEASAVTGNSNQEMDVSKVDFKQVYTMLPLIDHLPKQYIEEARQKTLSMDESMLSQTGSAIVSSFYRELGMDVGAIQRDYIIKVGLLMLLIALAGGIATVLVVFLSSRISSGVARDLRKDVFNKVESFSNNEFDKYSTASLITRSTNDVTQIQMLLMMGIRMICYAPIMGVGGIVMALRKSVSMSWIIALAVIVLIGIIIAIFSTTIPRFKIVQKLIDRLNLVSRESLNGLMVIRAFGTQKFEEERFDKSNRDLTNTNLFINRVMIFMMPAMFLIMNGITLLIVWVGAHQIANSAMQVGDMMAFMQYAMQIIMSFLFISMIFIMVPRAAVSGDRINEVLQTESSINDPIKPRSFMKEKEGFVEFKNVCFRYEGADEDVLEDISFVAKPGETTAFIGSTGAGKTTLINLIPRFYDVTKGEVLVCGANVKNVSQYDLREKIGYVPQKGILISGTIESNLRFGDQDASEKAIMAAAAVAQAQGFINEKEEGIQSSIAQAGTNVSGGQKQRLSIARALVKNPAVYIFDDSFSALDFKTDAALRAALKQYTGEATVLIVAQRVSTIMHAEQIIVMDEGKIVGKGTHEELLKNCPTYYEIASSQLTKEEL